MLRGHVDGIARYAIAGWAADSDLPDSPVEVVIFVDHQEHGRVAAALPRKDLRELGTYGEGNHGFRYTFDPPLSILRTYDIAVCFALNDEPLSAGRFRIAAESDPIDRRLLPVLLTSSGQPGCLGLMRSLADNRRIVAANTQAYGMRLLSYYAHALDVLAMPSPGKPVPAAPAGDRGLGTNPYHSPLFETAFPRPRVLPEFFLHRSKTIIGVAFKSVVSEFYATVAGYQGKADATLFAEQCDLFDVTCVFARLAFGWVREIVLLQDPRDAYCDCRTLWCNSERQTMAKLRGVCRRTIERHRDNREDTLFLRCEDLLLRPQAALQDVAGFLSLNDPLVAAPDLAADPAAAAVNRWQSELTDAEKASCDLEFADYIRLFGYGSDSSADA